MLCVLLIGESEVSARDSELFSDLSTDKKDYLSVSIYEES